MNCAAGRADFSYGIYRGLVIGKPETPLVDRRRSSFDIPRLSSDWVHTPIELAPRQGYILYATMSQQSVYETSFLVILCVLSLFLFPASAGPYPAVHGPATALQAARSCTQLQAAIEGAPRICAEKSFPQFCPTLFAARAGDNDLVVITWHSAASVLRC